MKKNNIHLFSRTGLRFTSVILAASLVVGTVVPSYAAAPSPSTDEAMYVNLDYYGAPVDVSIVKGVNPNGCTTLQDYGSYSEVINMSNYIQPSLTSDSVTWELPENSGRFYYECIPKEDPVLPWDFDVSYSLDGVPAAAEDLAGADGLVEITIDCIPNENANDYYRSNLILQAAALFDMQNISSLEAPGAQVQSVGTYKVAVFAAVPGEHATFHIRIGSHSFETMGIFLMMIPATLDQMSQIKEVKEIKDTVGDSMDSIHSSLNNILDVLKGMSGGLQQTQEGLKDFQQSNQTVQSLKGGVYENADAALGDLSTLIDRINQLIPHLQNSQNLLTEVNSEVNSLVSSLSSLSPHIDRLKSSIRNLQNDSKKLREMMDDMADLSGDRKKLYQDLKSDISDFKESLSDLEDDLEALQKSSQNLDGVSSLSENGDLEELLLSLYDGSSEEAAQALDSITEELGIDSKGKELAGILDSLYGYPDQLTVIQDIIQQLDQILDTVLSSGEALCQNGRHMLTNAQNALDLCNNTLEILDDNRDTAEDLLHTADDIGTSISEVLTVSETMIQQADDLNATLNQYEPDAQAFLKSSEETVQSLSTSLSSLRDFLSSLQSMLQETGKTLETGSQKTLDGLIDVMGEGIRAIEETNDLQETNNTVNDAVTGKIDEIEEDSNFLEIDPDAAKVSFTSEKNPAPESIQVILRTQEISLDDDTEEAKDLETEAEDIGFWGRVVEVFKNIWNTIVGLFT